MWFVILQLSGGVTFRNWCAHCIRGRSQDFPHRRSDHSEDGIPLLMFDYAYLNTPSLGSIPAETEAAEQSGSWPVLVGWDCSCKRFWSFLIPAKGVDFACFDVVVGLVVAALRRTGYRRINLLSDGEPALVSMLHFLNGYHQSYWLSYFSWLKIIDLITK